MNPRYEFLNSEDICPVFPRDSRDSLPDFWILMLLIPRAKDLEIDGSFFFKSPDKPPE